MYSPQVIDHFEHPRCAGELAHANVRVRVENPVCGDILELAAQVESEVILAVRFKAKGCVASMAAASALCERITGAKLSAASAILRENVIDALGGLPRESLHVSYLAIDGLKALLKHAQETSIGKL